MDGTTESTGVEGRSPDIEETDPGSKRVGEILTLLLRAIHACRLYPEHHRVVRQHREELLVALLAWLGEQPSLTLGIHEDHVDYREERIDDAAGRMGPFARRLYREGIREIGFLHGLSATELDEFLDLLAREPPPVESSYDLVTSFWERELPHVICRAVEISFSIGTGKESPDRASGGAGGGTDGGEGAVGEGDADGPQVGEGDADGPQAGAGFGDPPAADRYGPWRETGRSGGPPDSGSDGEAAGKGAPSGDGDPGAPAPSRPDGIAPGTLDAVLGAAAVLAGGGAPAAVPPDEESAGEQPERGPDFPSVGMLDTGRDITEGFARAQDAALTITDHELVVVKNLVRRELSRDPRRDLMTLLFELLGLHHDDEAFARSLHILGDLCLELVDEGRFFEAGEIVGRLKASVNECTPPRAALIHDQLGRFATSEAMERLAPHLEGAPSKEIDQFLILIDVDPGELIEGLVHRVKNPRQLAEVVRGAARRKPGSVLALLRQDDSAVVRCAVAALEGAEDPEHISRLLPLLDHASAEVRIEAICYLARIGDESRRGALSAGVEDGDSMVRTRTMRLFGPDDGAWLERLVGLASGRSGRQRPEAERREILAAVARIGSGPALEFLLKTARRRMVLSAVDAQNRLLATEAIGKMEPARAVGALESLVGRSAPAVRAAVRRQLDLIQSDEAALARLGGSE